MFEHITSRVVKRLLILLLLVSCLFCAVQMATAKARTAAPDPCHFVSNLGECYDCAKSQCSAGCGGDDNDCYGNCITPAFTTCEDLFDTTSK
jgi:hypothetical protein